MSAEDEMDQPTLAYSYALEQTYEIARGMFAAYQVDTGDELEATIRPWGDLDPLQRLIASRTIGPLLAQIGQVAISIGGMPS